MNLDRLNSPKDLAPPVTVELRAAKIPFIGWFACHHWFVVTRDDRRDRWEVWQHADAGGESWGHLHRNLMPPERGVGWGSSWSVQHWTGGAAAELAQRIETGPETYPFRGCYCFWPGPNSNTYAQWMLGRSWRLGWRSPGRRWARLANASRGWGVVAMSVSEWNGCRL